MELLLWFAICAAGAWLSVLLQEPEKTEQEHKQLTPWIASMIAHADPLEGYKDPLFESQESRPMELERARQN